MDDLQPRSYQLEMFEMSMEQNIIAVVSLVSQPNRQNYRGPH
jgi:hypothetical protein